MDSSESNSSTSSYVPLVPYNGTNAFGGDSTNDNLNIYYEVNSFMILPLKTIN